MFINMLTRRFCAQILLFNVQLTFCCVAALHEVGEVSFLQLTAKVAHHASDAAGTKVQLRRTTEFESTSGFTGSLGPRNTSKPSLSIFCYALESPADATGKQLRQQMKGCSDYIVFSYYSDPKENIVKLFSTEEMTCGKTDNGWADIASLMPRVLGYIINSTLPERFTWFVKLDPDSFFRPRFLYPILDKYRADRPRVLGFCLNSEVPLVRGAMEVFSHMVFRQKNTPLLLNTKRSGGEDEELDKQVHKAGFKMMCNDQAGDCDTMMMGYYNVGYGENFNASVIPDVLREFFAKPDLTYKELPPRFAGFRNCVHRHVVVAHPIKDVKTYEELQALDRASLIDWG